MGPFPTHDDPGPGWHAGQGDVTQFDDLGAPTGRAVGVDRRPPPPRRDLHDRRVQQVRYPGGDGELDVAGDQPGDEGVDVAGGVGAHHDPLTNHARVVTGTVTDGDLGGQLGDGHVDDGELIGTRVRCCVARPQDPGERFAVVGEAEHRMEPVAALVVRRRLLLVLRVDLDQRRVDVQHHRAASPTLLPTPRRGPRHARRATRRARRCRWRRSSARSSGPTPPCRTAPADRAAPPCPPRNVHRRRASPPPAPAAGPDHGPAPARPPTAPPPNRPKTARPDRPVRRACAPRPAAPSSRRRRSPAAVPPSM